MYVQGTILPSANTVQRVFKKVEQVGDMLVLYKLSYTTMVKLLTLSHMICQLVLLTEKVKDTVTAWLSTIDSARLTFGVNHITSGIKARDRGNIDPLSGLPIFCGANLTVQSCG